MNNDTNAQPKTSLSKIISEKRDTQNERVRDSRNNKNVFAAFFWKRFAWSYGCIVQVFDQWNESDANPMGIYLLSLIVATFNVWRYSSLMIAHFTWEIATFNEWRYSLIMFAHSENDVILKHGMNTTGLQQQRQGGELLNWLKIKSQHNAREQRHQCTTKN